MLFCSFIRTLSLVALHFAQILQLQHLHISAVVQLHNSLLNRSELSVKIKANKESYLAVNGEQLPSHVLVFVSQDHLHLIATAGNHRGQMISRDVDSPEIKLSEK